MNFTKQNVFHTPFTTTVGRSNSMSNIFRMIVLFIGIVHIADACTCLSRPLTNEFRSADIILVGKLRQRLDEYGPLSYRAYYSFSVGRTIKGSLQDTVVIETGIGWGDCGYLFREDVEYLIYAYKRNGEYVTSICTRTTPIAAAAADLLFFSHLPDILHVSSLIGHVAYRRSSEGTVMLKHLKIILKNDRQSYETTTNDSGMYFFYDISPGEYSIALDITDSLYFSPYEMNIRIDTTACKENNITLDPNTRIKGTLLYASSQPARDVKVSLTPTDSLSMTRSYGYFPSAKTDSSGVFVFDDGMSLGKYFLAINPNGATVERPHPTIYYPGVPCIATAVPIILDAPKGNIDVIFTIPEKKMRILTVKGHCFFKDNVPADSVTISMWIQRTYNEVQQSVSTGPDGSFSFSVVEHQRLRISWFEISIESKEEQKLLTAQQKGATTSFSVSRWPADTLQVDKDIPDLKLMIGHTKKEISETIAKYRRSNRQ